MVKPSKYEFRDEDLNDKQHIIEVLLIIFGVVAAFNPKVMRYFVFFAIISVSYLYSLFLIKKNGKVNFGSLMGIQLGGVLLAALFSGSMLIVGAATEENPNPWFWYSSAGILWLTLTVLLVSIFRKING